MNIYGGVLIDMTIAVVFDGLAYWIRASNANVSAEVALLYTPCVLAVGTTVLTSFLTHMRATSFL